MNLILYFNEEAPSRVSVYGWYIEFYRVRSSLQDEFRTVTNFRTTVIVRKLVTVPKTIDAGSN